MLVLGTLLALVLANSGLRDGYHGLVHKLHMPVNDMAMALFFFVAAKEIREARLPGGPLHKLREAATPLIATIGGMAGPALVFLLGAKFFAPELMRAWATPTATDIAFSYMIAKFVLGAKHPATTILLTLAVADDAGGLIIIAVAYPTSQINLPLFVGLLCVAIGSALLMKRAKVVNWIPYLLVSGAISWTAFYKGGLHPSLSLVPLAWCMPHAKDDLGLWNPEEDHRQDTLNKAEHALKPFVQVILGCFGFVNAGVTLAQFGGPGFWLVLAGLMVGKPLGIFALTKIGQLFGCRLPAGVGNRELIVMGFIAGVGFTVALFVATVAMPEGSNQDSLKMGALVSLASGIPAYILAKLLGVKRWNEE